MRRFLAACALLIACQRSTAMDAGATPPVPAEAATSPGSEDASAAPAKDAERSEPVDLRSPPLEKALLGCAAQAVGPRLGIRGTFTLHVVVEIGDGGTAETWVEDDGRRYRAKDGSCFDEWGKRVAASYPDARGRYGVRVKGPFQGWVVTVDARE